MLNLFVSLAVILVGIMVLLYFMQGRMLYPAPYYSSTTPLPEFAEKIELGASYGYLLKPSGLSESPVPLIIYTHGNGETADMWLNQFGTVLERGIAVLLVEYPGYGSASGKPSLHTIKETMLIAYDKLSALGMIDASNIVAYGRSIGGGAASMLASERPIAALALESTFSSLPTLVKEKGFPSFLLRDRYDNQVIVADLDIPIYIFHGTRDITIPFSHGERLRDSAKNVTFVEKPCGHNDCGVDWQPLLQFLHNNLDIN